MCSKSATVLTLHLLTPAVFSLESINFLTEFLSNQVNTAYVRCFDKVLRNSNRCKDVIIPTTVATFQILSYTIICTRITTSPEKNNQMLKAFHNGMLTADQLGSTLWLCGHNYLWCHYWSCKIEQNLQCIQEVRVWFYSQFDLSLQYKRPDNAPCR